jgi:hypothetical protein
MADNDNNMSLAKMEYWLKKTVIHKACGLNSPIGPMVLSEIEKVLDGICPKCGGLGPEIE